MLGSLHVGQIVFQPCFFPFPDAGCLTQLEGGRPRSPASPGLQRAGQAPASVELAGPGTRVAGRPHTSTGGRIQNTPRRRVCSVGTLHGASCMGPLDHRNRTWDWLGHTGSNVTAGGMRATPRLPSKQTSCYGVSLPGVCTPPCQLLPAGGGPRHTPNLRGLEKQGVAEVWLGGELGRRHRALGIVLTALFRVLSELFLFPPPPNL